MCASAVALCGGVGAGQEREVPPGFKALFNGKDLTGWKVYNGKKDVWGAENGLLYVNGSGGGWLMTEAEYGNFELQLEYKLPEKGNSGVALRAPLEGNPAYQGMEIQILDDPWYKENLKGLKPTQLTGSIYGVVPPAKNAIKPPGQWNLMQIAAKGRNISVTINGEKVVDANLDNHSQHEKEHPGLKRTKGHVGLQSHDGRVEFRRIFLKELE
jgi:hypothetical protein